MASGRISGPVSDEPLFSSVDDQLMCWAPLDVPGPLGAEPHDDYLHAALDDLAASARNFGSVFINDAAERASYARKIEQMSREVLDDVRAGNESAEAGAEFAHQMRDAILQQSRRQSSSIGKAVAEEAKRVGPTLEQLIAKYVQDLFPGRRFETLLRPERERVFERIIQGAGRSRPVFTAAIPRWRLIGRACWLFTAAVVTYDVWTAQNKVEAGLNDLIVFGGGALGGAVAGAATGLVCGPAAPFCSTALFIVGGIMGSLAAQYGISLYEEELREFATWLGEVW